MEKTADLLSARACPIAQELIARLSARQRQVLLAMCAGMSTKQIAAQMGRSVKTVETHRLQLMLRLETRTIAGLVRLAIRAGLIEP
jgi:DNA-binding CsgD family transcriptional regulator